MSETHSRRRHLRRVAQPSQNGPIELRILLALANVAVAACTCPVRSTVILLERGASNRTRVFG